jgi:hypothetical protein
MTTNHPNTAHVSAPQGARGVYRYWEADRCQRAPGGAVRGGKWVVG